MPSQHSQLFRGHTFVMYTVCVCVCVCLQLVVQLFFKEIFLNDGCMYDL